MEESALKQLIQNTVLTALAGQGKYFFPVAVSARHVHLSKKDFSELFGQGKSMTHYKALSQSGQFACEETVEVSGPKGSIKKVRVLGPERKETQVEISVSDSFVLGIKPTIRMSGDITGTPGCTLIGPAGKITLNQGVIVAARHVHMSEEQAAVYNIKNGDVVSVKTPSPRDGVIGNITVRVSKEFDLEIHLDTDEANGNGIFGAAILEAFTVGTLQVSDPQRHPGPANPGPANPGPANPGPANFGPANSDQMPSAAALELITERDINKALVRGDKIIYYTTNGLISPAAADRAKEKGIKLCKLQR